MRHCSSSLPAQRAWPSSTALATEFNIGVAIESRSDPAALVAALKGRSPRLGLAADMAAWMRSGVPLNTALGSTRDRLLLVRVNPTSRDTKGISDFFLEAYRAGIKPLSIVIEPAGATEARPGRGADRFRTSDVAGDGGAGADDAGLAGGRDSRARQARA